MTVRQNCPQKTVRKKLSAKNCPQETVRKKLSAGNCPQKTVRKKLSAKNCPQETVRKKLSVCPCPRVRVRLFQYTQEMSYGRFYGDPPLLRNVTHFFQLCQGL